MKNNSLDIESISRLSLEISERFKEINKLVPRDNDDLLNQLAASAIHMAFFSRDIYELAKGEKLDLDKKLEEEFFNNCGCDFNKKEKNN